MSGSRREVPPEVPGEFADAYRAAYEAAMREAIEMESPAAPEPVAPPPARPERRRRPEPEPAPRPDGDPEPTLAIFTERRDTHDRRPEPEPTGWYERAQASGYLVPALLVVLALVLVLGAYAVGRVFAGRVDRAGSGDPGVVTSENGKQAQQPTSQQQPGRGAWTGTVVALEGIDASADCTSAPGVDAGGDTVSYRAQHLVDRVADTTWRCDGKAIGQVLTFDLGGQQPIGEVGLIPGYAKTDDSDGTDRYAENNRVTKVRWRIGSRTVDQSMSGSAQDRSLRLLRIPRTTTRTVTLQILAVAPGSRDTTAISEVVVARATS